MNRAYRRVYIAAPIFNAPQLAVVRAITTMLKMLEFEYFSPYENSRNIWRGRAPKDCEPEERQEVLLGNITQLNWAHVLLAWVGGTEDGRTDTGVVWEMGHFEALQRYRVQDEEVAAHPRFTLAYIAPTDKRQNMNLMLAGTVDAVACGLAQLHRAVEMLKRGLDGSCSDTFHPSKSFMQEKEPIS